MMSWTTNIHSIMMIELNMYKQKFRSVCCEQTISCCGSRKVKKNGCTSWLWHHCLKKKNIDDVDYQYVFSTYKISIGTTCELRNFWGDLTNEEVRTMISLKASIEQYACSNKTICEIFTSSRSLCCVTDM